MTRRQTNELFELYQWKSLLFHSDIVVLDRYGSDKAQKGLIRPI